ncbi:hypothetical protein DYB37_013041 [Aphanomyces astaci]|uniref:NADPH-dependent FMN reductase-like domain-containing protein n=1 Tax=Aphanomyces astaci TaxID=112090 RepID=A0A3R7C5C7_APHAT|nr:hypothetical protein DYB35_002049 [Aphanomyces astaci]RHZ15411.1 hypothetical protein DYB37_013041 [Aphanomyces astaci]
MLRPLRLLASPVTNGAGLPTRGSPLPPRLEAVRAPNILIVHAGDDNLRDFGLEVARGAMTVSPHVRVLHPSNASFQGDVLWADGILVGSNVYNANIDPTLMQWINTWDIQHDLGDKVAGSFVVAGGLSAGEEAVQLALLRSMLVLRLVVVGGAAWTSAFGASAIVGEGPFSSTPPYPSVCYGSPLHTNAIAPLFLDKAFGLGERVASIASKLMA